MLYLNAAALQETAPIDLLNLLSVIWPGRLCTTVADTLSAETKAIAQLEQRRGLAAGSNFRYDGWDSERWRAMEKACWSLVEMDVYVWVNFLGVNMPELFYERMSAFMCLTPWYHFHHFRFSTITASFCFPHTFFFYLCLICVVSTNWVTWESDELQHAPFSLFLIQS